MKESLMQMIKIVEKTGQAGGNSNLTIVILDFSLRVELLWQIVKLRLHQEMAEVLWDLEIDRAEILAQ